MAQVSIHKVRADYWERDAQRRECYADFDYYVYLGDKLIRVCPSEGMAREVAAGVSA